MISRLANKKFIKSAIRIMGMAAAAVFAAWIAVAQPAFHSNRPSQATVDPAKLKEHVQKLSQEFYPRDWQYTTNLDKCADYIAKNFGNAGAAVESQAFTVCDKEYRNIIGRFGTKGKSKIIVGAHYDAYGNMPGADDNASGVAALIELAYLLGRQAPSNEVELVAYVLEEPPFFGTDSMGSAVHARSIAGCKADVRGVIVFEMVGYFSDTWGSQSYPALVFSLMYPSRANFIGVVGKWSHGAWAKADHDFSFVWSGSDENWAETRSTAQRQFTVYAKNGIRLLGAPIEGDGSRLTCSNVTDIPMGVYTNR